MVNPIFRNLKPDNASGLDFDSIIEKLRPIIPDGFSTFTNESQFEILVQALDSVLAIDGQWFLVNGELPLKDFFRPSEKGHEQSS